MTQHAPVAQHDDWVSITTTDRGKQFPKERESLVRSIKSFVEKTFTIVGLEARKLRHDPTDIFTRAVQPALWLLVFGEVLSRVRAIPTGGKPYLDFLAPGILAQSVLFIAIFSGIAIIWERDLGIVHERFMGIGQVLTMPLFFASNAIYPIVLMPVWLQFIARCNPLSYEVDALRDLMLVNGISAFGLGTDFVVLFVVTTVLVIIGARLYPRVAY